MTNDTNPFTIGHAAPVRYQRYAFVETFSGNLSGAYGEFQGNGLASETVTVVEPFLNRRGETDRTHGFAAASLVTAGAWLSRQHNKRPGYSLRFEDRWTAPPAQLAAWSQLCALESPMELTESGLSSPSEIVRGISLTGDALNVWLDTPAERSAVYLKWFSQVSVELQTAFRRWLPYLLLRDAFICNDEELRNSLLFYAATRPYLARARGVFTWDVICPDAMSMVYRSGTQNLPGILDQARRYFLAGGRNDIAERLAPSEARTVLIHVRRNPRALKGLLSLESKLVEAVLALGIKGREINSKSTPKNLFRFCSDWSRGTQVRIRRVLGGVAAPQLVDLALVEGTCALAKCMGTTPARGEWTDLLPLDMPDAANAPDGTPTQLAA